jgi:hypothetical protein
VLGALGSGVGVVEVLGVEVVLVPVAAGLPLSQPVMIAAMPQRTSHVQIFFISYTFRENFARKLFRRDRPAPSHYVKRPRGAVLFPPEEQNFGIGPAAGLQVRPAVGVLEDIEMS